MEKHFIIGRLVWCFLEDMYPVFAEWRSKLKEKYKNGGGGGKEIEQDYQEYFIV